MNFLPCLPQDDAPNTSQIKFPLFKIEFKIYNFVYFNFVDMITDFNFNSVANTDLQLCRHTPISFEDISYILELLCRQQPDDFLLIRVKNFVASLEFDLAPFVSKTLHFCRFFIVDVVTAG